MIVPWTWSQFLVVRPSFDCPYPGSLVGIYTYKDEFWLQIYGCPSDNCISLFGCLVAFLVARAHGQPKFRCMQPLFKLKGIFRDLIRIAFFYIHTKNSPMLTSLQQDFCRYRTVLTKQVDLCFFEFRMPGHHKLLYSIE